MIIFFGNKKYFSLVLPISIHFIRNCSQFDLVVDRKRLMLMHFHQKYPEKSLKWKNEVFPTGSAGENCLDYYFRKIMMLNSGNPMGVS